MQRVRQRVQGGELHGRKPIVCCSGQNFENKERVRQASGWAAQRGVAAAGNDGGHVHPSALFSRSLPFVAASASAAARALSQYGEIALGTDQQKAKRSEAEAAAAWVYAQRGGGREKNKTELTPALLRLRAHAAVFAPWPRSDPPRPPHPQPPSLKQN
jgi:hypothetical protein